MVCIRKTGRFLSLLVKWSGVFKSGGPLVTEQGSGKSASSGTDMHTSSISSHFFLPHERYSRLSCYGSAILALIIVTRRVKVTQGAALSSPVGLTSMWHFQPLETTTAPVAKWYGV